MPNQAAVGETDAFDLNGTSNSVADVGANPFGGAGAAVGIDLSGSLPSSLVIEPSVGAMNLQHYRGQFTVTGTSSITKFSLLSQKFVTRLLPPDFGA